MNPKMIVTKVVYGWRTLQFSETRRIPKSKRTSIQTTRPRLHRKQTTHQQAFKTILIRHPYRHLLLLSASLVRYSWDCWEWSFCTNVGIGRPPLQVGTFAGWNMSYLFTIIKTIETMTTMMKRVRIVIIIMMTTSEPRKPLSRPTAVTTAP